jgi:Cu-Zn family superoxide dismutase
MVSMRLRDFAVPALLVLAACGLHLGHSPADATATVHAANGDSLGELSFYSTSSGVRVSGELHGLSAGQHGIHLHAVGLCEGPAFTTAGGHINPASAHHGLSNPQGPHAGDMPNISAGSNGEADVDITTTRVTLAQLKDADGSSIVVHAAADDQMSDPAGNSGARVACGVIH